MEEHVPDVDNENQDENETETEWGPPVGLDPRRFEHILVTLLEIDPGEQRDIDDSRQRRIEKMAATWSWSKAEACTVRVSPSGNYKVIEGQGRTRALQLRDPTALMPCFILPVSPEEAAGVAAGIAKSRTAHGRHDYWKLRLRQGGAHEIAVEKIFAERQLRLGSATSPYTIGAVAVIERIMRSSTPEGGALAVAVILDILRSAYPDVQTDNSRARWNSLMLRAVWDLLRQDIDIQRPRLIKIIGNRPALQWISIGQESTMKHRAVVGAMVQEYNKRLAYGRLEMPQ